MFLTFSLICMVYTIGILWYIIYVNNTDDFFLMSISDFLFSFVFVLNTIMYFIFVEKTFKPHRVGIAIFYACIYGSIVIYYIIKCCKSCLCCCIPYITETHRRVIDRDQNVRNAEVINEIDP